MNTHRCPGEEGGGVGWDAGVCLHRRGPRSGVRRVDVVVRIALLGDRGRCGALAPAVSTRDHAGVTWRARSLLSSSRNRASESMGSNSLPDPPPDAPPELGMGRGGDGTERGGKETGSDGVLD